MMNKGLGRGLSALIPGNMTPGNGERKKDGMTVLVPISSVRPNVRQPRKTISQDSLEELAASIRSQGIIQPLIVRETGTPGSYEIIAGERRWRAARLAGLREVPVLVRSMSDEDVMIVALVENLQREDLNPAEEARAIQGQTQPDPGRSRQKARKEPLPHRQQPAPPAASRRSPHEPREGGDQRGPRPLPALRGR